MLVLGASARWENVTLVFNVSHNRGCEKTLLWFPKFSTISAVGKRYFGFQSFAQSRLWDNVTLIFQSFAQLRLWENATLVFKVSTIEAVRNAGVQLQRWETQGCNFSVEQRRFVRPNYALSRARQITRWVTQGEFWNNGGCKRERKSQDEIQRGNAKEKI